MSGGIKYRMRGEGRVVQPWEKIGCTEVEWRAHNTEPEPTDEHEPDTGDQERKVG